MTYNLEQQVLALTALRDALDERLEELRDEVQTQMIEGNSEQVTVDLNDADVATISIVKRKQAWHIDEEALTRWAEANYPDKIVVTKTIEETFKKQLLDNCVVVGGSQVAFELTGEVVNGLIPKPITQSIAVRFKPNGKAVVVKDMLTKRQTVALELLDKTLELESNTESLK